MWLMKNRNYSLINHTFFIKNSFSNEILKVSKVDVFSLSSTFPKVQ
jgi:hypothetical protein